MGSLTCCIGFQKFMGVFTEISDAVNISSKSKHGDS